MGGQGLCSVTADGNKVLIITAAKHQQIDKLMFCGLTCDYYNFISISSNTTQALAAHFDFTSFLPRPFFSSWPLLFYSQGVFG